VVRKATAQEVEIAVVTERRRRVAQPEPHCRMETYFGPRDRTMNVVAWRKVSVN